MEWPETTFGLGLKSRMFEELAEAFITTITDTDLKSANLMAIKWDILSKDIKKLWHAAQALIREHDYPRTHENYEKAMHEVSKEDAKVLVGDLEDPDDAFTGTVKKLIFEKMGSEYGYAVAMNFLRIYNLIPLPSTSTGNSKEILEAEKAKGIHSQGAMKETKEDAFLATAIEMQKEYRAAYMAQGREVRHPTIWDMDTEEPSERCWRNSGSYLAT